MSRETAERGPLEGPCFASLSLADIRKETGCLSFEPLVLLFEHGAPKQLINALAGWPLTLRVHDVVADLSFYREALCYPSSFTHMIYNRYLLYQIGHRRE